MIPPEDDTDPGWQGPLEPPGSQIAGFQILALEGSIAIGCRIFKAREMASNQLVMLKVVHAVEDIGDRVWEGLRREAALLTRLQHPNILQHRCLGESNGVRFSALEYVDMFGLKHALRAKPLANEQVIDVLELATRAVHFAHQRGVIHGDLKPAHVLLSPEGTPKVIGFEWAADRMSQSRADEDAGAVIGTPMYMAPELIAGSRGAWTPATDVYALGGILYELFTGRRPFQVESLQELFRCKIEKDPQRPRSLVKTIPRQLETIIMKCLQREPACRYATAAELADDLHRFREGRSIFPRPVGWIDRFKIRRWLGRPVIGRG